MISPYRSIVLLAYFHFVSSGCPSGEYSLNSRCFRFINEAVTFNGAEKHCKTLGYHLVSIHSAFENNFIEVTAGKEFNSEYLSFHIGLTSSDRVTWNWTDMSDYIYRNWAPGEPVGDKCTIMYIGDGTWKTHLCNDYLNFVCAGDENKTETTASTNPIHTSPALPTSQNIATTSKPTPATMAADVVFMIDMSGKSQDSVYDDFKQFLQIVTLPWTIDSSSKYTRIALMAVYSDVSININSLNSIGSRNVFLAYLDNFFNSWTDTRPGQNLTSALEMASSTGYMSPGNGYRSNIANHVLIYLTATTNFTDNPISEAKYVRDNNFYGVLTIGYGLEISNKAILKNVAGGVKCASFPQKADGLTGKTVKFVQDAVFAASSGGPNYCN